MPKSVKSVLTKPREIDFPFSEAVVLAAFASDPMGLSEAPEFY